MKTPKLCVTKTGVYYVYVHRKRVYLGKGDKKAIEIRYKKFLRQLLDSDGDVSPAPAITAGESITLIVLADEFMKAHENYYARHGSQSKQLDRFRTALSFPVSLYPDLEANDFGAKKLIETRDAMIATERFCRSYINTLVMAIRHVFSWGVEQEYVRPETLVALRAVAPLKRGKTDARETARVLPVSSKTVEATLPFLPPTVAAIVTVQRFTGMRPSEVLNMRVRDLAPYGSGFRYILEDDKTSYRRALGDFRTVYLGARAASACAPYLSHKTPDAFVFPADEENNVPYKSTSYGRAITRAAKRANVPHWSPYQLRHLFATEVRHALGLEAAQTALGHKNADVTQIYAERDETLAQKVADLLG